MGRWGSVGRIVVSAMVALQWLGAPVCALQTARGGSVHRGQLEELGRAAHPATDDDAEARVLAAQASAARRSAPSGSVAAPNRPGLDPRPLRPAPSRIDDDFVVFGYLQSESQVYHLRWHALTHVGSRFVGFNSAGQLTGTGAFTGRSPYLKAGGAAEAAGVRVVLVLANFSDGPGGTIETVMTSPARRATLVSQLVQTLAADSYSHGVSIDLEFSWGPAVRDGVTAFMHELRTGLDTLGPGYELSIYTNAIHSSNQWDFDAATGITPAIDYMLYSMYDWASGGTARAITDFDNCLGAGRMNAYLDDGLPPEKLVPVISAYSRRWSGTGVYGGSGSSPSSSGFTDALFDVTLNPAIGPGALNYVRGDEAGWYTWNAGAQRIRTFDSPDAMEIEIRHALSFEDPTGRWSGRRLGGVGFWSLMWMAEFDSVDPRTGGSVARTRTYPHVYQLCHEILAPPGTRRFVLEGFEGLDFRWRDPNESPDTTGDFDGDSSRSLVPAPRLGHGNAMRLVYDFEGGSGNRAVLAHEILASPLAPSVTDRNAALGHIPRTSRLVVPIHTNAPQPGYSVRLLVVDSLGQIEASPARSLDGTGWREVTWDLSDPLAANPFVTGEPAFDSGNGVVDSGASGTNDIGYYGIVIEGDGPAVGSMTVDEVAFEPVDPDGRAFRINEFRYAEPSGEFVEVHGPAGPLPSGLALRVYDSSDGSVRRQFTLSGSIPNDGGGRGFFVLGDPGVPNVDATTGFAPATDDLSNADPSALQLVDSFTGQVYDSVVYEAFGGLDELTRRETRGVTSGGWPWIGGVADGFDVSGQRYTMGRYPDGADLRRNHEDFSFQMASPGAPNGASLTLPAWFDFESPLSVGFQTFDVPRRSSPAAVGLPTSTNGGLAWRCVDDAGGGVIGAMGDAALGLTRGFTVTGEVYVPTFAAPAQAIAVGVCGSQGSTFFSGTTAAESAYESGYWLVYENRPGVQLADGRPDHSGVWELVHATHDNMDGEIVTELASLPNFLLGVSEGEWTQFGFAVRPQAPPGSRLTVTLNGQELYRGDLPDGGPTSGAFQIGFRENHPGPPIASEGTWVDALQITDL